MKRVLLVEDDQNIADLERDYLEINQFAVTTRYDGESGLTEGLEGDYDLIILDVMLPKLSGFDVCKLLREKIETPILMVSAKKEDIDKIRALGLGADDYITKPFSPSELVARVKAHLARFDRLTSRKESADQIVIRDIELDGRSHKVYVSGEEVTFTTKEFELLKFLMQNVNQVFNKEALFEKIWGFDAFGDTSTVVVHIKRIREKIELDSKNPTYLETIWGSGYRFNA
ncbi:MULTISPECIES: response regulator transcription factor [Listeria]|uniref:response regulator transcription factor n=1 Tax=Listeria TaxID=1637 RepID=UPI000B591F7A|nr:MULTISPECIES: response regulator transcription factor [Listeria]